MTATVESQQQKTFKVKQAWRKSITREADQLVPWRSPSVFVLCVNPNNTQLQQVHTHSPSSAKSFQELYKVISCRKNGLTQTSYIRKADHSKTSNDRNTFDISSGEK